MLDGKLRFFHYRSPAPNSSNFSNTKHMISTSFHSLNLWNPTFENLQMNPDVKTGDCDMMGFANGMVLVMMFDPVFLTHSVYRLCA